ncbi:MAG TPA: BTAD domain-containing putative transcriptional regulator [Pseudonocardiaceae bacterium]|nr:BTAD domain-containing putative transcriptional regulator [Pseudonocardiaceae bacterium]
MADTGESTFLILGTLELHGSGGPLRVGGLRQQTLMALLLLNLNQTVSAEKMVDELWHEPPTSARQQIHNAMSTIRRTLDTLPPGAEVVTTDIGYKLEAPENWVDAYRFRAQVQQAEQAQAAGDLDSAVLRLTAALAMWRGRALLGLASAAVRNSAAMLDEERLMAVEALLSLRLRTGGAPSIVAELRELVAEHPFRESLRSLLMIALQRSGRQVEALTVYDDGRRLLADEQGLDPGPEIRKLHADILRGTEAVPPLPGVPDNGRALSGATTTGRSYLPNDPGDFAGRSAELVQLLDQATRQDTSTLVISAIDGMGGVGKTTLAVRFAHEVAARYPDGQYFIDLHGFTFDMEPLTAAQALDSLLRDSGVPAEVVPPDLEGRLNLWRAHMAGQRAMIILDNVADLAHVRPLLPGTPGILVVVTSRRKMTALDAATTLSLDVLPVADAVALLTQIAGARRVAGEPSAAVTAVQLCGRLPLAIRIAAARLRDRRSWTVGDLVGRLEDESRRGRLLASGDRSVTSVLKVSYRYLTPQRQRLFRLLSLHPGTDVDMYSAAALADVGLDDADTMLESLLDDNLLRQDVADRYYFHDLIRDCARELRHEHDAPDDIRAARQRLFDYYVQAAGTWCDRLGGGIYETGRPAAAPTTPVNAGRSESNVVDIMRAEYANLAALIRAAARDGWHRHAWQLATALHPYAKLRNYDGNAIELFELGLRSAQADGDVRGEIACLRCLVAACRERGSAEDTLAHLTRGIELSRSIGDAYGEAAQMVDLGVFHGNADNLLAAYDAFRAAERLATDTSSTTLMPLITNNLGVLCRDLGRFDDSLRYLRAALETERTVRDSANYSSLMLWNIGMVHHLSGEQKAASDVFGEALDVSRAADFQHGETLALVGLCSTGRALGDLAASLEYGRQALALARRWGLRWEECETLAAITDTTFALREYDRARQVCEQTREYAREYGFDHYVARSLEGFAHLAVASGDPAAARSYWEQAVELYPEHMVDADYPRAHLAGSAVCFRCSPPEPSGA